MVLFSVKAALRRRPQRSQSTSYTSPVKWKQQTGIKAVTNQDKTFLLSSCTPWSNHLIICPHSATDWTKGLISFVQLRNFLGPEVRSILARDFTWFWQIPLQIFLNNLTKLFQKNQKHVAHKQQKGWQYVSCVEKKYIHFSFCSTLH